MSFIERFGVILTNLKSVGTIKPAKNRRKGAKVTKKRAVR